MLPKIPLYGPAAQLSPQVLLSRFGELGTSSSSSSPPDRRRRQKSASPRVESLSSDRRQLLLPSLPQAGTALSTAGRWSIATGGASGAGGWGSGAETARGPREGNNPTKGLATWLYKGDHTHRLPELSKEDPPPDGVSPRPARGCGGPVTPSERSGSSERSPTMPSSPMKRATGGTDSVVVAALSMASRDKSGEALTAAALEAGRRQAPPSSTDMLRRQALIRASFRHEAAAISSALIRLRRWSMMAESPPYDGAQGIKYIEELQDKLERSGLQMMLPRHNAQRAVPGSSEESPWTDDEHEQSEDVVDGISPRIEVACSIAVLNFIRWMCGLSPVKTSSARLAMCRVLGQALTPRVSDREKLNGGPRELGEHLLRFISGRGRTCLLHGEASLVVAVEKSLAATHMITVPRGRRPGMSREAFARALSARVEAIKASSFTERPRHGSSTRSQRIQEPAPPTIGIHELPPALVDFQVFWELHPDGASGAAAVVDGGAAKATFAAAVPALASGNAAATVVAAAVAEGDAAMLAPRQTVATAARASAALPRRRKRSLSPGMASPGRPPRPVEDDQRPSAYGLSTIWGDRRGALGFRRRLLNPALREFGAARQQDTCILWTSPDPDTDIVRPSGRGTTATARSTGRPEEAPPPAMEIDAVCYPPTGIVPIYLLEGGCTPWTIMPDSTKFQPTSSTKVTVWRVKIERPSAKGSDAAVPWTAERLSEVPVKGVSVDCSMQGEPFCIIFWPDLAKQDVDGEQLEVQLSGLCGVSEDLAFFYEFQSFVNADLDAGFHAETMRLRSTLGDSTLWHESRLAACCQHSESPETPKSPRVSHAGNRRRHSIIKLGRTRHETDDSAPKRPLPIELLSHHKMSILTNSVDLKIAVRSQAAATIQAELSVVRFGENEELVPNAVQVQKLQDSVFFIRVKLPMARCRYELCFKASRLEEPIELQSHPLKYLITTGEQCQTLLSSLEDPLLKLFGLARMSAEAQHFGIFLLAPTTQRLVVGACYFLIYVDEARALAQARAQAEEAEPPQRDEFSLSRKEKQSPQQAKPDEGQTPEIGRRGKAKPAEPPVATTLFSKRLLPKDGHGAVGSVGGPHPEVSDLHETLRNALESETQDGQGEIHLDLTTSRGECLRQFRERNDFPGFYECLINFTEAEVSKLVRLHLRFPRIQAAEFAPKTICEWVVCRAEHFPIGF